MERDNKKSENLFNLFSNPVVVVLFFSITLLIYYKSLFGSFIFDDVIVVLREPLLKKENFIDFLKELPFKERPIRLLTFYLDKQIWGLNPFGYRFTNLIIHIANGIVLYFLLQKLSLKKEVAFFATAIFLWHFVNPATVCYVTGRKDLLGFLFSQLSFFALLSFKDKRLRVAFFLLFYFLAFFTKEMYITLPLIVFAYLYIIQRKSIKVKYIILSLTLLTAMTYFVIKFRDVNIGNLYKRLSIPEYFIGYIRLFFDPTFPKVDYEGYFTEPYTLKDVNWQIFSIATFIMIFYFWWTYFLKKRDKYLSFLLTGFFISLLPILQIIQHSESFAEHYFYFPSVFLSVFIAQLFLNLHEKAGSLLLIVLLFIMLPYTYSRTKIFSAEDSFWLEAYNRNPKSFRAKQYYGQKLLSENKVREAKKLFEEGLEETSRLYNFSDLAYTYYYDFLNDLALCAIAEGDLKKAEHYYLKGLETIPESDKKDLFLFNLSIVYLKEDRDKAKRFMKEAFLKNPKHKEISYLLYDVYWQDGEMKELEKFIDEVLSKNPGNFFALSKKILFYFKRGDKNKGLELYESLKKLSPANYYELNDAAEIEIFLGNYKKAREYLLMALEEKPEYGRTRKNLKKLEEIKGF